MVYVDTSVLVTLYIKEMYSKKASDWIRANNEAIPKTIFHELEFTNAIQLKLFRKEISDKQARKVLHRFNGHEKEGIFFVPPINWPTVFANCIDLSSQYTRSTGSRSLDIIHVASTLAMGADPFFTFDAKQSRLASSAGLSIVS